MFGPLLRKLDKSRRFNPDVANRYVNDPQFPYIISFPRVGSHYLRMVLELYFERPLLPRSFYYTDKTDFLLCHNHDHDLHMRRERVIYLYRDPVNAIYSHLQRRLEPLDQPATTIMWSARFACHLIKWLHDETMTTSKLVLRGDQLIAEPEAHFPKAIEFLGGAVDLKKLRPCIARVTKDEVADRTPEVHRIMQQGPEYELLRNQFIQEQGGLIWDTIADVFRRRFGSTQLLAEWLPEWG
jgi:hypothetical protein